MEGFTEVSVIIEGALETVYELDYSDGGRISRATYGGSASDEGRQLEDILEELDRHAAEHGYSGEVYEVDHPHTPPAEDCGCAQYATDHQPARLIPEDRDEG